MHYRYNYRRTTPAQNPFTAYGMTVNSIAIGSRVMYWNHSHHHEEADGQWARLAGGLLASIVQEMFRSRIIR